MNRLIRIDFFFNSILSTSLPSVSFTLSFGFESFVNGNADLIIVVDFVSIVAVIDDGPLEDGCGNIVVAKAVTAFRDTFGGKEGFGTTSLGNNLGKRRQNFTLLSNISSTTRCTLDPRWGVLVLASVVYPAIVMDFVKLLLGNRSDDELFVPLTVSTPRT